MAFEFRFIIVRERALLTATTNRVGTATLVLAY